MVGFCADLSIPFGQLAWVGVNPGTAPRFRAAVGRNAAFMRQGRLLRPKTCEDQLPPKSSPKRIAAKKARESPSPRLSFSARLVKIHALSVKNHHNLLIRRHLPIPAFYSAVFQNALVGAL